ncbi:MAG: polysialyltransferase family glycosyltransferase, partial [Candidatus Thorarchaeota archaeon]
MVDDLELEERDIFDFFDNFQEIKIKDKKIGDILVFEDLPIWWVIGIAFKGDHLPNGFSKFRDVLKRKTNKFGFKDRLKYGMAPLSEFAKYIMSFSSKKAIPTKDTLAFLAYTRSLRFHTPSIELNENEVCVDRFAEIMNSFKKSNHPLDFFVLDILSAKPNINLRKYPNLIVRNSSIKLFLDSYKEARELNKKWKDIKRNISFNSKKDLYIFNSFKKDLDVFLSTSFLFIITYYYRLAKEFTSNENIKAILVYAISGMIDRVFIAAANKNKKKCYSIPHSIGFLNLNPMLLDTKIFVECEDFKKAMINLKVPEKNIVVVGSPYLNHLKKYRDVDVEKDNSILIITTPFVEDGILDKETYFKLIEDVLLNLSKIGSKIKIKLHPREHDKGGYLEIISKNKLNVETIEGDSKDSLYTLMRKSNFCLGFGSGALFEAVLLEVPVANIKVPELKKKFYSPTMEDDKIIKQIEPYKDYSSEIRKLLSYKQYKNLLYRKYPMCLDFRAHERIKDYVL